MNPPAALQPFPEYFWQNDFEGGRNVRTDDVGASYGVLEPGDVDYWELSVGSVAGQFLGQRFMKLGPDFSTCPTKLQFSVEIYWLSPGVTYTYLGGCKVGPSSQPSFFPICESSTHPCSISLRILWTTLVVYGSRCSTLETKGFPTASLSTNTPAKL
jgi:hypothetical protein